MAKDAVYQKTWSSYGHWDVVVLGGGASGTCAAIEAGVEVLLYTRFVDCLCEAGKNTEVVLAALEGLCCVSADVFIDCTGNADVAAAAGVPTRNGDENTGIPQPGTLMFEVDQVQDEAYTARPEYPVKAYRTPQELLQGQPLSCV